MTPQPDAKPDPSVQRQHVVVVDPAGLRFTADAGTSVLMAAQAAGIRLPSSCRNGTCRACICRLNEGQIAYRIEWPGLSADEKREGWMLPCVALARSDLRIDQPAAGALEPARSARTL